MEVTRGAVMLGGGVVGGGEEAVTIGGVVVVEARGLDRRTMEGKEHSEDPIAASFVRRPPDRRPPGRQRQQRTWA